MHLAQSSHPAVDWKNEDSHSIAMARRREFMKKRIDSNVDMEESYLKVVKQEPKLIVPKTVTGMSKEAMAAMLTGADSTHVASLVKGGDIYAGVRSMNVEVDASRIPPCTICASPDHGWRDCTYKCTTCGMLCCPGANPRTGSVCVVYSGEIEGAENALGDPFPKYLIDAMVARREKMIKDGVLKDLSC